MASVNKVILIGNLGRDPETRYSADGTAFTNFSIATTDRWKDKNSGEMKERTEWHNIVCAGRLAEVVGEHLSKGKSVYIEGKLQTRKWQDKDGNDRYTTEVRADAVQFLSPKGDGGGRGDSEAPAPRAPSRAAAKQWPLAGRAQPQQQSSFDDDDDIPF